MNKYTSTADLLRDRLAKTKVCSGCSRLLPKSDFQHGQSRCKLCQNNSTPSCGCGCGRHPETFYELYVVRVDSRHEDSGSYWCSQEMFDKVNGIKRIYKYQGVEK